MRRLRQAEGTLIVEDEAHLLQTMQVLLAEPGRATAMGQRAQEVVRREQGATDRHVRVIQDVLHSVERSAFPAIVR
jgi:3-deoxy-D-manno-octulosonic-acid transferase